MAKANQKARESNQHKKIKQGVVGDDSPTSMTFFQRSNGRKGGP